MQIKVAYIFDERFLNQFSTECVFIQDVCFNFLNFHLSSFKTMECKSDAEAEIIFFYDDNLQLHYNIRSNICKTCKSKIRELMVAF
jgi:hypothetical protein